MPPTTAANQPKRLGGRPRKRPEDRAVDMSLTIDPARKQRLEAEAKATGLPQCQIVRRALDLYFKEKT